MEELVLWAALKYPSVAAALMLIGILRVLNKPLQLLISRFVAWTPWEGDDLILTRVRASRAYLAAAFLIDWLASIKLPKRRGKPWAH